MSQFFPMKSADWRQRRNVCTRVRSDISGMQDILFFQTHLAFILDTQRTIHTPPDYLLTQVHFTVPRYTLFVLYYLSPSKFCALFSKTLQLITTTITTQLSSSFSSSSSASQNLTPTLLLFPRLRSPSGTYSIDRSARPCYGLSTVDPRYLVGFRGSYVDTLGMFVEEAGVAEQQ